jgi:hypothetical protein
MHRRPYLQQVRPVDRGRRWQQQIEEEATTSSSWNIRPADPLLVNQIEGGSEIQPGRGLAMAPVRSMASLPRSLTTGRPGSAHELEHGPDGRVGEEKPAVGEAKGMYNA